MSPRGTGIFYLYHDFGTVGRAPSCPHISLRKAQAISFEPTSTSCQSKSLSIHNMYEYDALTTTKHLTILEQTYHT